MWHADASAGNVLHINTLRGLVVIRSVRPKTKRFPTRNLFPLGTATCPANPLDTTGVSRDARLNRTRHEGATDDLSDAEPHTHRCPVPCPRLTRSRLPSTLIP